MSKILITSGCSFSECLVDPKHLMTWPKHLYESLKPNGFREHVSKAMGSQGNGLISRGIIYQTIKALETYRPEDILVGVMWSGSNRFDYRCENPDLLSFGRNNTDGWIENPTSFVDGADKNWVIMNQSWEYKESKIYYKYFHSFIGDAIYSLEHILRTQLFLKSKGVKYFFTNFTDNNIVDYTSNTYTNHKEEVNYLYNEIDFDCYLPVTSEHRWVYDNSATKEEFHKKHYYNDHWTAWVHPDTAQHKEFVDNVIYPWLLEKQYL